MKLPLNIYQYSNSYINYLKNDSYSYDYASATVLDSLHKKNTQKTKVKISENKFLTYIKYLRLPKPELEYHVYIKGGIKGEHPRRIDFAWPNIRLAIEIEGGDIWRGNSRHTKGQGFINDMKKYNWLSVNGWTLLRYIWSDINYEEIKKVYLSLEKTYKQIKLL